MRDTADADEPAERGQESSDRQFVTALARGMEVLRCFTPEHPELGTAEIAKLTRLPQPTVWRLCHTLTRLDYLMPTNTGEKLRLGPSSLAFGYAAVATIKIADIARPRMQPIADRFRAAVALGTRDRLDMVLLERCQADSALLMNLHVGSRLSMATSALGWAYLAAIPAERRGPFFDQLKLRYGKRWNTLAPAIEQAIEEYPRCGYVLNCGNFDPSVNALGVPVVSPERTTIYALNCGGPASLLTVKVLKRDVAPLLIECARALGAVLPETRTEKKRRS